MTRGDGDGAREDGTDLKEVESSAYESIWPSAEEGNSLLKGKNAVDRIDP